MRVDGISRAELSAVKSVWRVQQVKELFIKFGNYRMESASKAALVLAANR